MKLGIGARITAVFGLGALLLSVLLGGISYFTVRHFLLAGRESAAQQQAFSNASLVKNSLESGDTQYVSLLAQIDAGTGAHSVLYRRSKAYVSSLSVNASSIPPQLRKDVLGGAPATQTYRNATGQAEIAVGLPVPAVQAAYFEVFDLSDLDHTMSVLGLTLFVAGAVTTLLGIALGRFASRRLLRPLSDVTSAAGAIAGGELDTRLDVEAADPDLVGLTLSFNAMVDQLQERIEREARFNSDVSHELRSPLTTLSAAVGVLETDRDRLPDRSQRALQLLSDDLRRFQRMVSDLLEMSRADAGSVDVFLEEVSVSELVRRSVETGIGHMDARRHGTPDVVVDPEVERWRVGVDKRRFERVLVNLMENADHYGGGVTTIAVGPGPAPESGSEPAGLVEVTVDDAGPGIDPAERAKVFERFYRGSASGRRGTGTGTGLGLALVAEHMHVMHGDVRVESSPDGGARFVLSLPVLSNADGGGDDDDGDGDGDGDDDATDELVGETGADA
ncbi:MAG TPA: HAMP domain-containing sensor histidine kinase [Acidimicrobiales bacterium]|nr:HAMP domain-containing sensor histidine kinase [Acidimicrobiales bacterium]